MSYERLTVCGTIGAVKLMTPESPGKKPYLRLSVAVNRMYKKKLETTWYSVFLFGSLIEGKDISNYRVGKVILVDGTPSVELFKDKETNEPRVDTMLKASSWPQFVSAGPQHGPIGWARLHVLGKIGAVDVCGEEGDPKQYVRMSVAVDKPVAKGGTVWYSVFMFSSLLKGHGIDQYQVGRSVIVEGNPESSPFVDGQGESRVDRMVKAISWPTLI